MEKNQLITLQGLYGGPRSLVAGLSSELSVSERRRWAPCGWTENWPQGRVATAQVWYGEDGFLSRAPPVIPTDPLCSP